MLGKVFPHFRVHLPNAAREPDPNLLRWREMHFAVESNLCREAFYWLFYGVPRVIPA